MPDPPLESKHDSMPGPKVLSAHENVVVTTAFCTYTPPPAGDSIEAVGGPVILTAEPVNVAFLTAFAFYLPTPTPQVPLKVCETVPLILSVANGPFSSVPPRLAPGNAVSGILNVPSEFP